MRGCFHGLLPDGNDCGQFRRLGEHVPTATGHPPGQPIEPRPNLLSRRLPVDLPDGDASHAVGMTAGNFGVDLRVAFSRIAHE